MYDKYDSNIFLANSLKIEIPYFFIKSKFSLTWNELYFGIKCGFLPLEVAINKATEETTEQTDPSSPLFELASLYKEETSFVNQHLVKIFDEDYFKNGNNIQYVKEKWLYIVLAWLYENKENYNILYAEQENKLNSIGEKLMIVWDDFGNLDIIKELVDLAPSFDGTSRDIKFIPYLNLTWEKYLKSQEIRFDF